MRLSELAPVLKGTLLRQDAEFHGVGIDSRGDLQGRLFVALHGARFDGHDFLPQAREAGAVGALVTRPGPSELPQLKVADTQLALGQLARYWRHLNFDGMVVGVTGSNGKTTVKEMIAQVLAEAEAAHGTASLLKTQGNLNNAIGVPLTLLRLRPSHRFAVIEMGANHAGEIAYVAGLAEPQAAVITNAGPAHLEGFGSLEGVARAKGELIAALPTTGTAVLNADDRFFPLWREIAGRRRVITFGLSSSADVSAEAMEPLAFSEGRFRNRFRVRALGERFDVDLALPGRHNVINALAATACGLAMDGSVAGIQAGLARMVPVSGRLRPLPAKSGAWLLDDCYNANPASFEAGLDALGACGGEPWVVLGAFGELGPDSKAWHTRAGELAKVRGVRRLLAVGDASRAAVAAFGIGGEWFASQAALIDAALDHLHAEVRILIKGSRSQHLETTVEALQA
ncbi:MAG: UDP-N-acetylmuramoyl-tripeptide--D-alanyl-D-alanine ligase [Methylohalobius crimeensis]